MPDNNQTNTSLTSDVQAPQVPTTNPADSNNPAATGDKEAPIDLEEVMKKSKADALALMPEVAGKIADAHNILVALSGDPSVDEMAAAIGLSLYLDRLGKRATAIYSGATPNALEFLEPEKTFDTTADTLQDFVIALNKEKADHLRYKLDGDYVKIFITPYRSRISEEDLEFSYGDFNIDLVLALDVANGVDLDAALREHGRIMHDASVVNITTGNPGKFGEIEWSDKSSSSISEMVARLIYSIGGKVKVEPAEATAFLTGIVAATDRFSKGNTYADTMLIASKLLDSGADQQLIAQNISGDLDNQFFTLGDTPKLKKDPTALDIKHEGEIGFDEEGDEPAEVTIGTTLDAADEEPSEHSELLDELKATADSLAANSVTTPDAKVEPVRLDAPLPESAPAAPAPTTPVPTPAPEAPATPAPVAEPTPAPAPANPAIPAVKPEMVIKPAEDFMNGSLGQGTNKYGEMLEAALAEAPAAPAPSPITSPEINPAAATVPPVPAAPEINGVPDINYMPPTSPDSNFTPPTPPIDFGAPMPPMGAPIPPQPPVGPQPAMQDQVYAPQAASPDAFKIPGM